MKKKKAEKKAEIVKASQVAPLCKADAVKLNSEIKSGFKSYMRERAKTAEKLNEFIVGKGWLALGYQNMTDWREKEIGEGEFYYLRNMLKLLSEGVPPSVAERIPITNINTMARTLTPKEWKDEKWQKAAAEMKTDEFQEKAQKSSDEEGRHVEILDHRGFSASRSIIKNWDLALRIAETLDGADTMERRVEAIVSNYLNSPSEKEGKNKLQAYEELIADEVPAEF